MCPFLNGMNKVDRKTYSPYSVGPNNLTVKKNYQPIKQSMDLSKEKIIYTL